MTSDPVVIPPFHPDPVLRTIRHGVNNLLAPLLVAAEILDDGEETAAMMHRATRRLARTSERLGLLTRPVADTPEATSVARIAEILDLEDPAPGRSVLLDPVLFTQRVLQELLANEAEIALSVDGQELVLISTKTGSPIPQDALATLAIPMTLTPSGVGLSLAIAYVDHCGGRVLWNGRSLEFRLPLLRV